MRVLVTGSRTWSDVSVIHQALCAVRSVYRDDMVLVHGACPRGADNISDLWAVRNGVSVERFPADWRTYGRSAGHKRNAEMIYSKPGIVLAFIRDNSPGATGCLSLAVKAGLVCMKWEA